MRASLALVLIAALVHAACGTTAPSSSTATSPRPRPSGSGGAPAPARIGLVSDAGGFADAGLNALANAGRMDAERELGVQTSVIESKRPEEYAANLSTFAQLGYDLIIGVGPSMRQAMWRVARQNPGLKFALIDAAPANDIGETANLPNVANLFFAEQEGGYLAGIFAGVLARDKVGPATHNTVCSLGLRSIPSVDKYIAGFQDAVRSISPSATLINGYLGAVNEPGRANAIGKEHVLRGCDVLMHASGPAGLGYIAAAKESGVFAIGTDIDQGDVAAGTVVTSAVKRANRAVYETIRAVKAGTYKVGDQLFNVANDGIGYGRLGAMVSPAARALADQALADIKSGKLKPKTELTVR